MVVSTSRSRIALNKVMGPLAKMSQGFPIDLGSATIVIIARCEIWISITVTVPLMEYVIGCPIDMVHSRDPCRTAQLLTTAAEGQAGLVIEVSQVVIPWMDDLPLPLQRTRFPGMRK